MEAFDDDTLDPATRDLILQTILRDIEEELSTIGSSPNDRKTALLQWKHHLEQGATAREDLRVATDISRELQQNQSAIMYDINQESWHECSACSEQFINSQMITNSCSHCYCRQCARRLLDNSLTDENLFPPRCCGKPLPLEEAHVLFDKAIWARYEERKIEHSDQSRTYCSDPNCSSYILPSDVNGDVGKCRTCNRLTCTRCKLLSHTGKCPDPDHSLLSLAREEGWRRCSNCGHMVELRSGCNHITCRCGYEYCYVCAARWKECDCAQWDEARLVERAETLAARRHRTASPAPEELAEIREYLVDCHDCDHGGQWTKVMGEAECEECDDIMPLYILECDDCGFQACNSCKWYCL